MLRLNDSISNGSLIHLEIEESQINVTCYNNAIFVYNNVPEFATNVMKKKLSSVICRDSNFPKVIEESKTGQMTVYFRPSRSNEGFNAVLSVLSCQLGTCVHPFACSSDNQCVCSPGLQGLKCEIVVCPNNCSESLNQGTCDKYNNRCNCNHGFGGDDCSRLVKTSSIIMSELFSTQIITDNLNHLKKTLPRFGHTVNADRRGFLWIFGGFSLSNGALNDIRQFDTKNHTWMQVTVDGSDTKMPVGRYFHASEVSKQSIYTYGGLSHDVELLNDFWVFNIQEGRWAEVETESDSEGPGFLSGHSLTLVKIGDRESLFLIGGYTNDTSVNCLVWEFSFNKLWRQAKVKGSGPTIVFGHSTVYQASTFYIFGGYQMVDGTVQISKKLYSLSLHDDTWHWSIVPIFSELNRPEENLPRSRFLHSSIGFAQYMVVYGGESSPVNATDYLNAYVYKCNAWVRLTENLEIIGKPSDSTVFGQAVAVDSDADTNNFYVVGGIDSSFNILRISIPTDICQLWSNSKYLCRLRRGCSFGTVTTNNTKTTFCFSSDQKESRKNEISSAFNHGLTCDSDLLKQRNCSSFDSCSDCEAIWPSESSPSCVWCKDDACSRKKCSANVNGTSSPTCESCSAVDCEHCMSMPGCNWTRKSEKLQCLSVEVIRKDNLETFSECPQKCASFEECDSCLTSNILEGGFAACEWSTKLSRCLSPAYKSLICSGANCGLLLSKNESDQCPRSCESYTMCSRCLQNAYCGWCATESGNDNSGDGVCVEGSLDRPFDGTTDDSNQVCKAKYETVKNATTTTSFSWNFLKCPPENECLNNHHTCDNKTEQCVDLTSGFHCKCASGYHYESGILNCLPICLLGCVHGNCVEPGVCKCDFGYVGNNCSIQCLCNGHSNCVGPDRLDICTECRNNTIGKQCEKCDKFFVGDPKNNVNCVSCSDYCNGHSDVCVSENLVTFTNLTRDELEATMTEGARVNAVCLNCANQTDGNRCETCIAGHFRGTSNLSESCRKCQCNGHGDICDPVTGEKCNCANNTESDNTCP